MRSIKARGLSATYKLIKQRLINPNTNAPAPIAESGKIDYINFVNQFLGEPHGNKYDKGTADHNQLQWVIPNFGFGSGGHLNIFRFINILSRHGYKQNVVILPPFNWASSDDAKKALEEWYFPLNADVSLGVEGFRPAAVTFATGWQTAYWVDKHQASAEKFYFIQDFEPYFQPVSTEYFLAENTYRLGLKGITAGSWLSEKLSSEYGMQCAPISFGVEHDLYQQKPKRKNDNFNILFYSRHVTPRRLFGLGLTALDQVCKEIPNAAVIFAGGDVSNIEIPFHHLNCGELTLKELPDLYSQCDLALILSGTNLSLLPLEVAACGCPLVLNDDPSAKWLLPDDAAFYTSTDPNCMAKTIIDAIKNQNEREARGKIAKEAALASSWEKEGEKFIEALERLRSKP